MTAVQTQKTQLEIRPMRSEDFEPLLAFCRQMHQESPVYRMAALDQDKLLRLGELIISTPEAMCGLVALQPCALCRAHTTGCAAALHSNRA